MIPKVITSTLITGIIVGAMAYVGLAGFDMMKDAFSYAKKSQQLSEAKAKQRLDALETTLTEENTQVSATDVNRSSKKEAPSPDRKPASIVITNDNMNSYWDPAAEDRIKNMAISSELRNQILENYRRTGVLPEAVASSRKPASINR